MVRDSWRIKLYLIRHFISPKIFNLFLLSIAVGFVLFLIESSFIFILQGFLFTIGILERDKLSIPDWYPLTLGWSVTLLVFFGVMRCSSIFLRAYLAGVCQQAFVRLQRSRIFSYGLWHASEVSSHQIINLFSERVIQAGALVSVAAQFFLMATSAIFLFALGFRLATFEMVISILLLAVCLFPLRYVNHRIRASAQGLVTESEKSTRLLVQGMRHNFFLRIYGLVANEVADGLRSLKAGERHYVQYYLVYSFKGALPLLFGTFIICATTYVSVTYIHTSPVKLLGFFYIFIRLSQTMGEMNSALSEIRLNMPSFRLLFQWHKRYADRGNGPALPSTPTAESSRFLADIDANGLRLSVNGLGFSYDGRKPIFSGLNFNLAKGDVLVVHGRSGSGKSTLLSVLLGLQPSTAGSVSVNEVPIERSAPWLSSRIGYIGPEPYLVPGTVRENLMYGHQDPTKVTEVEIWDALEKAQVAKEVRALPAGLEESLLETAQLSTGQKQRLSIARGLLRNPSLFILDEASANLDSSTEQELIQALKPNLRGMITLVVSHKDAFNSLATTTLEMDGQR